MSPCPQRVLSSCTHTHIRTAIIPRPSYQPAGLSEHLRFTSATPSKWLGVACLNLPLSEGFVVVVQVVPLHHTKVVRSQVKEVNVG